MKSKEKIEKHTILYTTFNPTKYTLSHNKIITKLMIFIFSKIYAERKKSICLYEYLAKLIQDWSAK